MQTNPLPDEQIEALCERLRERVADCDAHGTRAKEPLSISLRNDIDAALSELRSLREPYEAGRLEGMREAAEIANNVLPLWVGNAPSPVLAAREAITTAIRSRIEESRDG